MALTINTNIASLNAQMNLGKSQGALNQALARLSSGLRINSPADDPAGYAIAQRMSAQINGFSQAVRNANDGISFAQVANGALNTVTDALQNIRTLAVQAANSTNSAQDRQALNAQVQQSIAQVNSTAQDTQFNGQSILNGSLSNLVFQVGANAGQTISTAGLDVRGQNLGASYGDGLSVNTANLAGASGTLDINNVAVNLSGNNSSVGDVVAAINNVGSQSGVYAQRAGSTQGTVAISGSGAATGTLDLSAYTDGSGNFLSAYAGMPGYFMINGIAAGSPTLTVPNTVSQLATDINSSTAQTGVTASLSGSNSITFTSTTPNSPISVQGRGVFLGINQTYSPGSGGGTITIDGVAVNVAAGATTADVAAAINAYTTQTGVTAATGSGGNLTLTDSSGADISVSGSGGLTVLSGGTITAGIELYTKVGGSIALSGDATTLTDLGLSGSGVDFGALKSLTLNNTNVLTYSGAKDALKAMDFALSQLSSLGGTMGALQSRFQATIANLQAASQNTAAARSRISDADFAAETANLSRAQILQQAGVAMVAQANAQPQLALSLLR